MVKMCQPLESCQFNMASVLTSVPLPDYYIFNSTNSSNVNNNNNNITTSLISYSSDSGNNDYVRLIAEYVLICVVSNLIVLVGLTGNILCLIVLSKSGIGRDTTTTLLMILSVNDIFVLLTHGVQYLSCFACWLDIGFQITFDTVVHVYFGMHALLFSFLTVDMAAIIAVERAISVFFPFRVAAIFNKVTVKVIMLCITFPAVGLLFPIYVGIRLKWPFDPVLNVSYARGVGFVMNWNTFIGFLKGIENANLIVAMVTVFVCGSATAIKIVHQSKSRKSMTSCGSATASKQEQKAVKVLLTICFFTFMFTLPNIIVNYVYDLMYENLGIYEWYCFIRSFVQLFTILNSSVNFFIYFFMSSKFQGAYREVFNLGKNKTKRR